MFVVVNDILPDETVDSYDDMAARLIRFSGSFAYEYAEHEGVWVAIYRYMVIEKNDVVRHGRNGFYCPPMYRTYTFPNVCGKCKRISFMRGKLCGFCDPFCHCCGKKEEDCTDYSCPDCGVQNMLDCKCKYTDF